MVTHEPGRELDALIAERVMGLTVITTQEETSQFDPAGRWVPGGEYYEVDVQWAMPPGQEEPDVDDYLPGYSTRIDAAWQVVERFERLGYDVAMHTTNGGEWVCVFRGALLADATMAPTAPHAICLAALKSAGVTE